MNKKSICILTALTLALSLLAGCGGDTPEASPSPSPEPSQEVVSTPEPEESVQPSGQPSESPEVEPTAEPTTAPTPEATPAPDPTAAPTAKPTTAPTPEPTPSGPEDGNYTANVTLAGGTGRATVQSPAALRCSGGQFYATIVWSSPNFDYMKVNGTRYDLISAPGANSTFEIPVAAFDTPLNVIADTVAMSEPHEVEYTLTFDYASMEDA